MSETVVYLLLFHQQGRPKTWHREIVGIYSSLEAAQKAADLDDLAEEGVPLDISYPRAPLTWHRDVQCAAADDVRWSAWANTDDDDTDNRPWPRSRFYEIMPFYLDGNYVPISAVPQ